MTAKRGGLGKGLDSLIKENKTAKHTAPAKKEVVNAGPIIMKINDVEQEISQTISTDSRTMTLHTCCFRTVR